jgi:hypothetical protein
MYWHCLSLTGEWSVWDGLRRGGKRKEKAETSKKRTNHKYTAIIHVTLLRDVLWDATSGQLSLTEAKRRRRGLEALLPNTVAGKLKSAEIGFCTILSTLKSKGEGKRWQPKVRTSAPSQTSGDVELQTRSLASWECLSLYSNN